MIERLSDANLDHLIGYLSQFTVTSAEEAVTGLRELRERRAAEQWPTCSTCVHHHTNSPTCYRGVGRPNKIDERVDQFTFGCNQHASAPPVPASERRQ